MIPKIIHFFWGNSTMPYMRYLTIESFAKHNPSWEIRLYLSEKKDSGPTWTSFEQKAHSINSGSDYSKKIDLIKNLTVCNLDFSKIRINNSVAEVHKSDILRWYLLYTIGGVWGDMDIIFIKPIDPLVNNKSLCITKYDYDKSGKCLPIGFIGSESNNEVFKEIYEQALLHFDKNSYQCSGTQVFSKIMVKHFGKNLGQKIFNEKLIYPVGPRSIDKLYTEDPRILGVINNAIAIHWYGGHNKSAEYCNKINSHDDLIKNKRCNLFSAYLNTN